MKYFYFTLLLIFSFSAMGIELKNNNFSNGLDNWEIEPDDRPVCMPNEVKIVKAGNNNLMMIHVEKPKESRYCRLKYSSKIAVPPGQILEFKVIARAEHLQGGYGLFPTMTFCDGKGEFSAMVTGSPYDKSGQWLELTCKSIMPTNAATVIFGIWLHGSGTAFIKGVNAEAKPWRNAVLKNNTGNRSAGTTTLQATTLQVTDEVTCNSLMGFGFEDDGWFYNEVNKKAGVTEKDYKLNENRIKWLEPDWVRMFFWHHEWQPDVMKTNFTFESPNMKSHYKTLELYQEMNVPVVYAGADWGQMTLYDNPEAFALGIGEMFDYLIKKKGFTCVKYWTLLNEPDHAPTFSKKSFRDYVLLHKLVKKEFKRRNLDIKIVGSDDASNINWFRLCAFDNEYYDLIDIMSSHRYFRPVENELIADYFAGRMEIMEAHYKKKPFITAEYGFINTVSDSHYSPLMETYDYALLNTEFCIEMLNSGSAGASVWTSHSAYYAEEGSLMKFGLWRFKDKNWSKRPVYYSAAMFMRNVKAGQKAFKVSSDNPENVLAGKAGNTVFWVNKSDNPAEIIIKNFPAAEVIILSKKIIDTNYTNFLELNYDNLCKSVKSVSKKGGIKFKAPPRSFGYLKK